MCKKINFHCRLSMYTHSGDDDSPAKVYSDSKKKKKRENQMLNNGGNSERMLYDNVSETFSFHKVQI